MSKGDPVYIYALSYHNPYNSSELFGLFVASRKPLDAVDVVAKAIEVVTADGLGNEWVDSVAESAVCGPLAVDGRLTQPTIAILVD